MRRYVFACVALSMVLSSIYVLKPTVTSRPLDPRVGHPVASIGDVFRHY